MKNKKKVVAILIFLFALIFLGIGLFAYFYQNFDKKVSIDFSLNVNQNYPSDNKTALVLLKKGTMKPGNSGMFTINVDLTGSADTDVMVEILRDNLPDNLKFYLDKDYVYELTRLSFLVEQGDYMKETVSVYWVLDGSNKLKDTSVGINVSATVHSIND